MSQGWRDMTEGDIKRLGQKAAPKASKYKAVKTVVDGITFDSKKEAQRWQELQLLEQAGKIDCLKRQPEYELFVQGKGVSHKIGVYRADFYYWESHRQGSSSWADEVVEDVKGMKTALYRWKKKHFEAQYGIQIRET